ncbi:MAG: hypothetical protein ABI134_08430, partial [Byssovorax sp.]
TTSRSHSGARRLVTASRLMIGASCSPVTARTGTAMLARAYLVMANHEGAPYTSFQFGSRLRSPDVPRTRC